MAEESHRPVLLVERPMFSSMLRHRRHSSEEKKETEKVVTDTKETTSSYDNTSTSVFQRRSRLLSCVGVVVSVLSVGFVAPGACLVHWTLHTHEECDMTYSHRHFVEIELDTAVEEVPYKLYKFTDARDPRHWSLQQQSSRPLTPDDDWCKNSKNNTTVVPILFIPGHGGNYQQSRSLGAHALGLTASSTDKRTVQKILARDEPKLDVYTVDFQEEGTALSGFYLKRQTEFVTAAIHQLVTTCGFASILLVGHSMGGLVARAAATEHVHSIVTLGTPHVRAVFALEPMAVQWHKQLSVIVSDSHTVAVISIAGGLRDEMVPPETCQVGNSGLRLLATDLMELPEDLSKTAPNLGMDHKAIVWCHNLLGPVRRIVGTLHETQQLPTAERLQAVRDLYPLKEPFSDAVLRQHISLRVRTRISCLCCVQNTLSLTRFYLSARTYYSPRTERWQPQPWKQGCSTMSNGSCGFMRLLVPGTWYWAMLGRWQ
jgi:pimeloyl-ACP methyl ester carboxylesterase